MQLLEQGEQQASILMTRKNKRVNAHFDMEQNKTNYTQLVYGNYNAVAGPNSTAIVNVFSNPENLSPPLQKPKRIKPFVGRKDELSFIFSSLKTSNIISLSGPAGIGKTALITELIWNLAPNDVVPDIFPDGIIYYNFYNQPNSQIALENFARLFGELPLPTPYLAAQRTLSNKKTLLILDSFEECDNPNQITEIVGKNKVILVSRLKTRLGDKHLQIYPLPKVDAVKLLSRFTNQGTQKELETITDILGHIPYAISIAGYYLEESQENVSIYISRLAREPLSVLNEAENSSQNISSLFENNINLLSNDAKSMLMLLGLFDFEHPNLDAISYSLSFSELQKSKFTSELIKYGIALQYDQKIRLSNRLLHFFVKKNAQPKISEMERLAEYFLNLLENYDSFDFFDKEYKSIILIVNHSVRFELWDQVERLTWALLNYLERKGFWTEKLSMASAGYLASVKSKNSQKEIDYLMILGLTHLNQENYQDALSFFQHAFQIAIRNQNIDSQSAILGNIAIVNLKQGFIPEAFRNNIEALKLAKKNSNLLLESNQLANIGKIAFDVGKYDQAIRFYKKTLNSLESLKQNTLKINILNNIANAYSQKKDFPQAILYGEQALVLASAIEDDKLICNSSNNLGNYHKSINNLPNATNYYKKALQKTQYLGDKRKECSVLNNLANTLTLEKNIEEAHKYLTQSLTIAKEINNEYLEATISWNLGSLLVDKDIEKAINLMNKSVEYEKKHNKISSKFYETKLNEIKDMYL